MILIAGWRVGDPCDGEVQHDGPEGDLEGEGSVHRAAPQRKRPR